MNTVTFPDGETRPALGLGTWRMGESDARRRDEVAAVRHAIELGYRVIDTAEMYGEGEAEAIVGEAVAAALRGGEVTREQLFVVSKVYPHNASRDGTLAACERSRRRLGLDTIDLYLLHWRGPHPLAETVAAFESLRALGRIRHWGVSNFDRDDMEELSAVPDGTRCATDQVYYSLGERGAGFDLLPWLQHRGVPLMAYCPIDQGRLGRDEVLAGIGAGHGGASAAQVALAWLLCQDGVMAIPKAVRAAHLRENLAAVDLALTRDDLIAIDAHFAPPRRRVPLAMS
jgi:diketogulonate reductase-like aldo/keto reductase